MSILNALFGCTHKHLSFPITLRGAQRRNATLGRSATYVVCFDCGCELPYDWKEMKIVRKARKATAVTPHATEPGRAA